MKYLLLVVFFLQLAINPLSAQQLLTLEGGTNNLLLNSRNFDDEYLNVDVNHLSGFQVGLTLKLDKKKTVDGKVLINFTNSVFNIQSAFDKTYEYGNANVDVAMNSLRFAYMIDYTVGRKVQYFLNAGPSFAWIMRVNMDGSQNSYEVNGTEISAYEEILSGKQDNVVSRGVFSLYTKTGFTFPINRKMSFQISSQLIYDLNNNTRDYLKIAANTSITSMLYLNFMAGLTYDVGLILHDEEWGE